jgi:hypothetical protein
MVQVQSSWFPLIDRNPQVFMDIPAAKPGDFRRATNRVWRSADRPSSIRVLRCRPHRSPRRRLSGRGSHEAVSCRSADRLGA